MTHRLQHLDSSGFTPEDDLDEVLGHANPNHARAGCPSRDVLNALARRELPIGDARYEHLLSCSPCYREFRSIQQTRLGRIGVRSLD